MFFTKYPSPANFSFPTRVDGKTGEATIGKRKVQLFAKSFEGGISHVGATDAKTWPANLCLAPLDIPAEVVAEARWTAKGDLEIDCGNQLVLRTVPGEGFGLSGRASLFQFVMPADAQFFGMGQKNYGQLELSGIRSTFWNTDVWSDFHWAQWGEHPADPPYFSLPYLAVRTGDKWFGFLLHNPSPAFMETPGSDESRIFVEWQRTSANLILGTRDGEPNLWVIVGDSLAEITRKLQKLIGTTPVPPLWSIGYQQSRWGYGGHDDLLALDKKFAAAKIPCSGLWLDLDYMDGFRVFQTDAKMFPKTAQVTADKLAKNGRRIVPIIDPGVKFEPGYRVYDDGHRKDVFCKNQEGKEFIGMVWPGQTVFPDFTKSSVRKWWAGYAREFRECGFGAAWVDMNDPSTGPIDPHDMLFEDGTRQHLEHRNQYALGMQMATVDGFRAAFPNERPFLLSRSGFIGSSRYSAIWTGDNVSNDFYLKLSLTTSLGMSISGLPFNGPDIGGFGGDSSPDLMIRWMQACFLFPFCRNHATKDSRNQEPFAYNATTAQIIGHYVRLRYKFLPYLYQLFCEQELVGDPVLRPLMYEFGDRKLAKADDSFMVGPAILQAPIITERGKSRQVTLPGRAPWYDLMQGKWVKAGKHTLDVKRRETPIYLRAGSVVATQAGMPTTTDVDLLRPEVLIAVPPGWTGETEFRYVADDGLTLDYQKNGRSVITGTVTAVKGEISIQYLQTGSGFGQISPTFVVVGAVREFRVNGRMVTQAANRYRL